MMVTISQAAACTNQACTNQACRPSDTTDLKRYGDTQKLRADNQGNPSQESPSSSRARLVKIVYVSSPTPPVQAPLTDGIIPQANDFRPAYQPSPALGYIEQQGHHHHYNDTHANSFSKKVKAAITKLLAGETSQKIQLMVGVAPLTFVLVEGVLKIKLSELDHDHDGVLIDFDEAAHGLYAFLKNTGNLENFSKELRIEADLLVNAPDHFLKHELSADGIVDLSILASISAPMLVFAFLAAKAGWSEFKEALHMLTHIYEDLQTLRTDEKKAQQNLRNFNKISNHAQASNPTNLEHQFIKTGLIKNLKIAQENLKEKLIEKKLIKHDKWFGLSSFFSGSAISAKVCLEGVTKLSTLVGAKLTGTAAMGVGVTSQVVLAPLTGVFAFTLGWVSYQKTKIQRAVLKELKINHEHGFLKMPDYVKNYLSTEEAQPIAAYQKLLKYKTDKATHFFKRYKRLNQIFMAGAALYTAVGAFKASLIIAASAGASLGALAEPVTAACILGGLSIGGVVMAMGSMGFILGHPYQQKHQEKMIAAQQKNIKELRNQQSFVTELLKQSSFKNQNLPPNLREGLSAYTVRYHAQFYKTVDGYCESINDLAQTISEQKQKPLFARRFFSEKLAPECKNASFLNKQFKIWRHHKKQSFFAGLAFMRSYISHFFTNLRHINFNLTKQHAKTIAHARYDHGLKTISQNDWLQVCQAQPELLQPHISTLLENEIQEKALDLKNKERRQRLISHLQNLANSESRPSSVEQYLSQEIDRRLASPEFNNLSPCEKTAQKLEWLKVLAFSSDISQQLIAEQRAYLQDLRTELDQINSQAFNQEEANAKIERYQTVLEAMGMVEPMVAASNDQDADANNNSATNQSPPQKTSYQRYLEKISGDYLVNFKLQRAQRNYLAFAKL